MASIYLPPIARKKKVEGWPRDDTTRVFADFQADNKQEDTSYHTQFIRHNVPPAPQRTNSANRKNKPQPTAVTFLRQNPRFICEPICHVDTSINTEELTHPWWPNESVERPVTQPHYTFDSTSRDDYRDTSSYIKQHKGYSRYNYDSTSNSKPTVGLVPGCSTTASNPSVIEKISYEHQYNARLDPNHPIRGKRHGCFVWKVSTPVKSSGRSSRSSGPERRSVSYELTTDESIGMNNSVNARSSVLSASKSLSNPQEVSCAVGKDKDSSSLAACQKDIGQEPEETLTKESVKKSSPDLRPQRPLPYSPPPDNNM
ncbi:predicted protein [Nematostella vectensis]|uniref:Uncharacterized protein n=1 Tax=Nematostella vectensis TaxID=45351 RepID=A7SH54_NEMVE|nr:predicted protein [Nematostella vectensis]|eukprot:XP_001629024.1 predicted protein [Nematostella vectensis]